MRIAVLADIHANLDALEAVLADGARRSVDALVCLGDCVGYGAEPEAVVRRIQALRCPVLMGNHEMALVHPRLLNLFNPVARTSLVTTRALLSDASHAAIATWPQTHVDWGARFVHGFPPASPFAYLFQVPPDRLRRRLETMRPRLCFVGHTHLLELVTGDGRTVTRGPLPDTPLTLDPHGRYIVNVGSVGQPRDGSPEAKYVIWEPEHRRLCLQRVVYPYADAADKIRRAGLPEAHARRLLP